MNVYFWALNFIPFFYISVFMTVTHYDSCSCVGRFKTKKCDFQCSFYFFFMIFLSFRVPWNSMNFRTYIFISAKILAFWQRVHWVCRFLWFILISSLSCFPTYEHEMSFHLLVSYVISFNFEYISLLPPWLSLFLSSLLFLMLL